jgi:hypothetical protein
VTNLTAATVAVAVGNCMFSLWTGITADLHTIFVREALLSFTFVLTTLIYLDDNFFKYFIYSYLHVLVISFN